MRFLLLSNPTRAGLHRCARLGLERGVGCRREWLRAALRCWLEAQVWERRGNRRIATDPALLLADLLVLRRDLELGQPGRFFQVLARVFRRPDPGPFDVAKMMPVAYVVAGLFVSFTVLCNW